MSYTIELKKCRPYDINLCHKPFDQAEGHTSERVLVIFQHVDDVVTIRCSEVRSKAYNI